MIQLSLQTLCFALPDGDVDGDGRVTGVDALLILRVFVGLDPITPRMAEHGIITEIGSDGKPHPSGKLTLADALLVLEKATRIITWDTDTNTPNQPPTANAGSNQSITLNAGETSRLVTLSGSGSDPDGSIASYLWSGSPSPSPATAATATVTLKAGTYTFTLITTDNQGAQSTPATVTITVNAATPPVNQAPTVTIVPVPAVTLPASATLSATVTDDGKIQATPALAWSKISGPGTVTFGSANSSNTTASFSIDGSYVVQLSAYDGELTKTETVTITVNAAAAPVNQPPIANAGSNQSITLNAGETSRLVTLSGSGSDPDGSITSYLWSGSPSPSPATAATATVTLRAGTYTFTLITADNQGAQSAPSTVTIAVNPATPPVNQAPTVTISPVPVVTLPASATLSATVTDDGKTQAAPTLTWSKVSGPGTITFGSVDTSSTTVSFSAEGSYVVQLSAFDGELTSSATVSVTVTAAVPPAVNQAPTVTISPVPVVTLPASATLSATVTDDGKIQVTPSLTWSKVSGPGTITFGAVNASSTTASFSADGSYIVQLSAYDGELTKTETVTITVNAAIPVNQPPTVTISPVPAVTLPASATLSATVTDDGKIQVTPTLTWSTVSGPGTVIFGSPSSSKTTASFSVDGSYILQLSAYDGELTKTETVTVTVNPAPVLAPVITTQSLPVGKVGVSYVASVSASDPAGAALTFTLDQGPAGMTINAGNGSLNWLPGVSDIGTAQVAVSVRNLKGKSDRRSFVVTVPDSIVPSINFSAPPVQLLKDSTTTITAAASDNIAVKAVTFFVDGVQKAVSTSAPYQFDLLSTQPAGTVMVVRAVAEDTSGNTAIAETGITVFVVSASNPNNQAPQLGVLDLSYTVAEGGTLTIPVTATDPDTGDTVTLSAATTPPSLAHSSFSGGSFSFSPDYTQAGSYSVTFRAVDPYGLTDQKTVAIIVTDVNRPPVITTTALLSGRVDYPYSATITATDPDSDPLSFSLTQGPTGMTINTTSGILSWKPTITDIGSYTFTIAVSDGKGGSDSRQFTLQIPDTIPPTVTLSAPKEAIPGARFTVVATATDNKAVTLVTIAVAGQAPVDLTAAPFEHLVTLPDTLAVGATVIITATAKDAAANSSSASATVKIIAIPDTVKPTVTLSAPTTASPGSSITLSAVATDNQGVAKLDFSVGGVAIGTVDPADPTVRYLVPASVALDSTLTFSVTATDFSGNSASAQATSTVVAAPVIPDTTPPTVSVSAPASIAIGSQLPLTISASDDKGVASVELLLAHNRVATFTSSVSQTINLPLPDAVTAGMELVVELKATDQSGNQATAATTVSVVTRGQGVLTGAVYDDSTGLPVPAATVTLALSGQTEQSATTDSHGRYAFVADEGSGGLTVTASGYNRVDRAPVATFTGSGHRVADARLTPLPTAGTPISAVLGGALSAPLTPEKAGVTSAMKEAGIITVTSGTAIVTLPSGAVTADQTFSLIQIGAQGLQGTLPAGWSPLAAIDLIPHGITFVAPVSASVPNLLGLPVTAIVVAARWDESSHSWLTVGPASISADGATLSSTLSSSGQHVFLIADAGIGAPASPVSGAPVTAATNLPLGLDLQARITPQPKLILYKAGVSSSVGSRVAAATPLTSGSTVWSTIAEDYSFYSGDRIIGEPYAQDIVLYSFGLPSGALLADYPVAPGLNLSGQVLEKGVISVTTSIPPVNADLVTVVGPQGGAVSVASGEALIVPAAAVNRVVPISIKPFDLSASGLTLPPGFTLLGGVTFSIPGTSLQLPAALSIPLPLPFTATGDILLVRPVVIGGSTRFAVIGRGTVNSGRLLSTQEVPGSTTVLFPGITTEGSVFFLQTAATLGYAGGSVSGTDSAPFSGALISSDTLPLVALSGTNGGYVTVVAPGAFTLTALDTIRMDKGSATGNVTASAFAAVDLSLKIDPPTITGVTPITTATNVALSDPVVIRLSEPVVAAGPANLQVSSSAGIFNGSVELSVDGMTVTFRHTDPFASNTLYTVTVSGLIDRSGTAMTAPFTASFTSLNTAPPVAPPAANISATIPGTDGKTTVSGTQGSAGLHDTVTVVNLATGARNPALVDPNGSFSVIFTATVKDKLQLEITSPAGITTTVALPRFKQTNSDSSVSEVVGNEGGRVLGPAGVAVDVPSGAFPDGAVITLKPVTEADFPFQLSPVHKQNFSYTGGVKLFIEGKEPLSYLNMSIPTSGGETLDDQWVLTQAVDAGGAAVSACCRHCTGYRWADCHVITPLSRCHREWRLWFPALSATTWCAVRRNDFGAFLAA